MAPGMPTTKIKNLTINFATRKFAGYAARNPKFSRSFFKLAYSTFDALTKVSPNFFKTENISSQQLVKFLLATNILDFFASGTYILDLKGMKFVYGNYAARSLIGVGKNAGSYDFSLTLTPESQKIAADHIFNAKKDDPRRQLFLTTIDQAGNQIPIVTTPRMVTFNDGNFIIGTLDKSILSAINDLQKAIPKTLDLDKVLSLILEKTTQLFKIDACAIKAGFDVEQSSFVVLARQGVGKEYDLKRSVPITETASFHAFDSGKIVEMPLLTDAESASRFGMRAGIYVPLWSIEKANDGKELSNKLGTLCLYSKSNEKFESLQRKIPQLLFFANCAAKEIRDAIFFQEKKDEAARLLTLQNMLQQLTSSLSIKEVLNSLVNEVKSYFDSRKLGPFEKHESGGERVRSVSVYIYDKERKVLVPAAAVGRDIESMSEIKVGEGIIGRVVSEQRAIIVENVPKFIKDEQIPDGVRKGSFVSVPLIVEKAKGKAEILGVLSIASDRERYFDAERDQLTIEKFIAPAAAIAIRNARDHYQAQITAIMDTLIQKMLNQRFGPIFASELLEDAKRKALNFSMLIVDLDKFKSVNDNYGHLNGDRTIIAVGNRLVELLIESGILYRFGGEEFVYCLEGCSKDAALLIANRLRQELSELEIETEQGVIKITASIGVATYPDDVLTSEAKGSDWDKLFSVADGLLYLAKLKGRNRVEG